MEENFPFFISVCVFILFQLRIETALKLDLF